MLILIQNKHISLGELVVEYGNDSQITALQMQKLCKFRSSSLDQVHINCLWFRQRQSGSQYPPKESIAHQGRRQQCHQEYLAQHIGKTLLMVILFT